MIEQRDLYLYTLISSESIQPIVQGILSANFEDALREKEPTYERQPIELFINCYGGDMMSAFGLVSVMEQSRTPIYTYGHGAVCSAALPPLASGHKRFGSAHTSYMYHDASQSIGEGKTALLEDRLNEMKRLVEIRDRILMTKTNLPVDKMKDAFERKYDWFFDSQDALKYGVIDQII